MNIKIDRITEIYDTGSDLKAHALLQEYSKDAKVSIKFIGAPKILAIILNSFRTSYNAEMHSLNNIRLYTMNNISDKEKELCDKWYQKLEKIFKEEELPEDQVDVLASRNAEYFISIFAPIMNFTYVASISDWNVINEALKRIIKGGDNIIPMAEKFIEKLKPTISEFTEVFESSDIYRKIVNKTIVDNAKVGLIPQLYPNMAHPINEAETYHDAYCSLYYVSFNSLSELQRIRSIRYIINDMRILDEPIFYVPDILDEHEDLKKEWADDMESIKEDFPQGLAVEVTEIGYIGDFLDKCEKFLYGSPSFHESIKCICNVLLEFYSRRCLSPYFAHEVEKWIIIDETGNVVRISNPNSNINIEKEVHDGEDKETKGDI